MSSKLHVSVGERTSDPDRWHPGLRRNVKGWAETRIFWRRGAPSYPTRDAVKLRSTPPAAIRKVAAALKSVGESAQATASKLDALVVKEAAA